MPSKTLASDDSNKAEATRREWLRVLAKYHIDREHSGSAEFWSPKLDTPSRDELRCIQDEKLAALVPFLYENSAFYRRRFGRLALDPRDIRSVDDLVTKWPVVTKTEMAEDVISYPPYGTYSTMTDQVWADRGWMLFSSSGTSGTPRVFRYSHADRELWAWVNARAIHAMGIGKGDTIFLVSGFGPHSFAWGVQYALERMGLPSLTGGGMDAAARGRVVVRYSPTVLLCTPSYALHLGRVLQNNNVDPRSTSIKKILVGGEPAISVPATRKRIQELWDATLVEFYGCTEVSPHVGGYSCQAVSRDGPAFAHLMEDIQIWETVDPVNYKPVADGTSGLTVCTSLMSESSAQLRFLVGDYTVLDHSRCACGRSHVRAMGSFSGRSDDLINLRGIKLLPVQIEEVIRSIGGIGDEYEIHLTTDSAGLDTMTLKVEHPNFGEGTTISSKLANEMRTRCEVRVGVEVLSPGTLPKTEFKAARVKDQRARR
jgi:phenylacetate-CoA ligase